MWQDFVFPLRNFNELIDMGSKISLDDFEVLAAGGLRLIQIQQWADHFLKQGMTPEIQMKMHPACWEEAWLQSYELEEDRFVLNWPKTQFIYESLDGSQYGDLILTSFKRFFPCSYREMGAFRDKIIQDYLSETQATHWLIPDRWTYFYPFIKNRFSDRPLLQEYLLVESTFLSIDYRDLEAPSIKEYIQIEPSFKVLKIESSMPEYSISPGVWGIWLDRSRGLIRKRKISALEAFVFEVLERDWSLTLSRICEMLAYESRSNSLPDYQEMKSGGDISNDKIIFLLKKMKEEGIILF